MATTLSAQLSDAQKALAEANAKMGEMATTIKTQTDTISALNVEINNLETAFLAEQSVKNELVKELASVNGKLSTFESEVARRAGELVAAQGVKVAEAPALKPAEPTLGVIEQLASIKDPLKWVQFYEANQKAILAAHAAKQRK